MNSKSTSPSSAGASGIHKRRRKNLHDESAHLRTSVDSPPGGSGSPTTVSGGGGGGAGSGVGGSSSSFRNVSACNRCRLRKNRCDQRLPACLSCEKAGVRCVGYDPITKREIPRSYVHYLETRVSYLESLLSSNNIAFPPADDFPDLPPAPHTSSAISTPTTATALQSLGPFPAAPSPQTPHTPIDPALTGDTGAISNGGKAANRSADILEGSKLDSLVSDIGLVSFAGASDPRYLGSVSGISFARVVFAAVKSTASGTKEEQVGNDSGKLRHKPRVGSTARVRGSRGLGIGGAATKEDVEGDEDADTQMRDSFFGLHTKPTISPAPFPTRAVAQRLVDLYFEHANPQIPSLHRGQFSQVIETIYGGIDTKPNGGANGSSDYGIQGTGLGGSARERYLLNIVCAIGAGIFLTTPDENNNHDRHEPEDQHPEGESTTQSGPRKKQKTDASGRKEKPKQYEPESYHASAMLHLESFLSQSKGGLEELQAVLLLASYALLRPVSPGLWYIVGVALRLAVDLGLHYEDADLESKKAAKTGAKTEKDGRREWVRDMRRRLWWCVYSLDRLVSTCVGRPFGIADEVISTQFPSLLDDDYIHPTKGLIQPPPGKERPSYKLVSHQYFRLRLLQSEILQVLQQQSHAFSFGSANSENAYKRDIYKGKENYPSHHPYHLQTPYLLNHTSLQSWHKDVDRRLQEWIDSAPKSKEETGVAFSPEFLELNYWQAKIMLYRPCLSVPVLLAGELGANNGNNRSRAAEGGMGRTSQQVVERGKIEHEDRVYLVVAQAGTKVLRLYRQLHRVHQVNYTFLATHHLFMAGISFLYAIWHSPLVRSRLSMDEVDFTILAATSVLGDLVGKCPPAEACKDAFERMSRATVQMCLGGKRGPTSTVAPSGTYHSAPRDYQPQDIDGQIPHTQHYQPTYQGQPMSHQSLSPTQEHHRMPPPMIKTEYPAQQHPQSQAQVQAQAQAQAQVRRQTVHFDDGFQELFTSPRPQQLSPASSTYSPHQSTYTLSPTTPTENMQYQSIYPQTPQHTQNMYPQQHQDMMIDPALQQRPQQQQNFPPPGVSGSEWGGNIDMTQFGIAALGEAEWEPDNWSEEGGSTGQVDLFDGFFFGGGGN